MRFNHKNIIVAMLAFALAVSYQSLSAATGVGVADTAAAAAATPTPTAAEREIEDREKNGKGIRVDPLVVLDDATLQQMLEVAERRLATLQVIDQSQILSRLGAISGASQRTSGFALNVQGAPLPGVATTDKGATGSTTASNQLTETAISSQSASTSTGTAGNTTQSQSGLTTVNAGTLQAVSGQATQDVVTTRGQFGPPGATAPSPTTTIASSGYSVASSNILNEQMQLTAEINGLRLMLGGNLSGHFVKAGQGQGGGVTKLKTTLGFPITLSPGDKYKDAVAVVEVEVSQPSKKSEIAKGVKADVRAKLEDDGEVPSADRINEKAAEEINEVAEQAEEPMVTALLPREKTYNVAAITDKSFSLGGGVATQIVGVSASWLWGSKTYYLVQDQDTVAKMFKPVAAKKIGFKWEFRPVLGQRVVKEGLRQTMVQLAFAAPRDAVEGEIGVVKVRTYWRAYDRKRGVPKQIIANSLNEQVLDFAIPRYSLAVSPPSFNSRDLEELGGGQVLVNLKGRYLPGTYVRIGSQILNSIPAFLHEHAGIRFAATVSDLAHKDVYLVAHDGTEVPLKFRGCGVEDVLDDDKLLGTKTTQFIPVGNPVITAQDDTNSLLKVKFAIQTTTRRRGAAPVVTKTNPGDGDIPGLALSVGQRVFAFSELKRKGDELSVVIPADALSGGPELTIQKLMPKRDCRSEAVTIASGLLPLRQSARLVLLEQGAEESRFLLSGTALSKIKVLSPRGVVPDNIGGMEEADRLRLITLTADQLESIKQLLIQRDTGRPFFVDIPAPVPKPRAKRRATVGSNETEIVGEGLTELVKITYGGKELTIVEKEDKSVRLRGLKDLGVTAEPGTRVLQLFFKGAARPTRVELEIVNSTNETVSQ